MIKRDRFKHTNCLAFTAPPDDAIDWRVAVFVLKLRLAMVKTKNNNVSFRATQNTSSRKHQGTTSQIRNGLGVICLGVRCSHCAVNRELFQIDSDHCLEVVVEFGERGGSPFFLIGGGANRQHHLQRLQPCKWPRLGVYKQIIDHIR